MTKKLKAASMSILVNIVLFISKVIVAIMTGSVAMLAECAHSLFDLISSFLAFIGIKMAQKPDDEEHSFGHEKFESLSSLLQAVLIAATSIFVFYEAYHKLLNPSAIENSEAGIFLMILTIPITIWVSRYLSKVAKETGGSQALEADSAHFTTDVIGSIAVLLGLLSVKLGFPQGDAIAAIIVGIVMLYISFELIRETYYVFMDYNPKKEIIEHMTLIIRKHEGTAFHKLRARRAGSKIFAEFHLHVDGQMNVIDSHALAMNIKRELIKEIPAIKDVTIHVEPKGEHKPRD